MSEFDLDLTPMLQSIFKMLIVFKFYGSHLEAYVSTLVYSLLECTMMLVTMSVIYL